MVVVGVAVVVAVVVDPPRPTGYPDRMSYVMPPNNAIAVLCSQNTPESVRRSVFEAGLRLELSDYSNTPGGQGVVRGWGTRGQRRR